MTTNSTLPADLPVVDAGGPATRTALVLHGGGGPRTVAPLVAHLAPTFHVVAPTHPGWDGTALPGDLTSVAQLATGYLGWLLERGERDVVLVGSSIGGWIALEMAVQATHDERYAGVIGAVVDIDGVGVVVDGEPVADFFALDARGLAEAAWHDPERGYIDPATLTDEQRAVQQANGRTMAVVAGSGMADPTLLGRLGTVAVPTLVLWGDSDGIVTPAYGRAVADAVPGAEYAVVPEAGHLPHLEAPAATWAALDPFLSAVAAGRGEHPGR
jgi:pimeloyl-ACP methyl ester carboxylesterase